MNCCISRAATGGINSLKQARRCPAMQNNIWSHELGSSSSSIPLFIVAFSAIGFAGMGNPKAALESKAATAVVLIRPTGGWGSPRPHRISISSSTNQAQPLTMKRRPGGRRQQDEYCLPLHPPYTCMRVVVRSGGLHRWVEVGFVDRG